MPNILKRPMFRRGGPASYGVGITSGLAPRKKYERGTNPFENTSLDMNLENYPYNQEISENMEEKVSFNIPSGRSQTGAGIDSVMQSQIPTMEAYADVIEKRLRPTDRENVLDYLTSIGAAGAGSPTSLKTFGSVFGEAAKNYQAINAPKEQVAKKAGTDVFSALLKGSLTKEKLYLYQQKAKDLYDTEQVKAQQEGRAPKYKTPQDALFVVINQELYGKDTSQERLEKDAEMKINKFNLSKGAALAEATIERRLEQDPEFQKKYATRYKGSVNESLFQKDIATGNYILKNLQSKPNIRVNDVFVEPYTKKLYYFDGKKLVPEIN